MMEQGRPAIGEQAHSRSRRGRPTISQAARIDQTIITVARTLFLSQGYAVTSMEAVAAKAGVSKGTLYARYASKSDLFRAIAADRLKAWSLLAPGPDMEECGLKERLLRRAINVLNGMDMPEVRAFERLLTAESVRFPELARDFYDRGFHAVVDSVRADLCTAAGARAEQAMLDPLAVAKIFAAALIGWYRIEASTREVSESERLAFAARLVALCLAGLGRE